MTRALARAGLLFLSAALVAAVPASGDEAPTLPRGVLVVLVPGVPFERLLGDPDIRTLAASGGAGLMPATQDPRATLQAAFPAAEISPLPTSTYDLRLTLLEQGLGPVPAPLSDLGRVVRETTGQFDVGELMVLIVGERPSEGMRAAKDELLPVILAIGPPASLFSSDAPPGSLTSDSTRRAGVVAVPDLPSTILSFAGAPIPRNPRVAADTGAVIRVLGEPAPFLLHERYLAQRRMYVPVGEAAALYLVLVGLLGVAFVALGRRVPDGARRVVGWGCLSVSALATGMLAAGHLPELTYATVVPFIAIVTAFGTLAFSPLEGRSLTLVPAGIGVAVLVYFAVEALLGWSGALATFLGGTHLDGGRFYGLPNAFIGLLAGAGLYVAQRLRTSAGFALLLVIALVAGLPFAGANLGGAVTLFAAAGLWVAVRERERLGPWRGLGVLALTVVAGTALILLAHWAWPVPTHITRFEENAGGPAGIWSTFVDRLGVGIDLIRRNPAALVPVLGMPVALLAVLRPPASIRATFERWPAWRDAVLVTLLTGIVAYLANDSGPAAAGLAFGLGLGGMLGVSLLATAGKMDGS